MGPFRRIATLFRLVKLLGHFHLIDGRKYVEYPNGQIRRGESKKVRHGRKKGEKAKQR